MPKKQLLMVVGLPLNGRALGASWILAVVMV